jgi:hypothetical protein
MAEHINFSVKQENKKAYDIWQKWRREDLSKASDKLCKLMMKASEEEQKQKQLIQSGGPGNPNEQFLQQAEFENGIASPIDNLSIHKLNEVELTEAQLSPLNDEQAIQLAERMYEGKKIWEYNQKFVWDFFDISFGRDSIKRENVLTIKNSEYERKRKEQEREAMQRIQEQARKHEEEKREQLEKQIQEIHEHDKLKTFEKLAEEITSTVSTIRNMTYQDKPLVARKLKMTESQIENLSSEPRWKIKDKVIEQLRTNGYATAQQIQEYDRIKAAERAEQQRRDREYEREQALLRIQREEEKQKQEAERKKQKEDLERQIFENSVNALIVGYLLNPKADVDYFLSWNAQRYNATAEDFERIRAIPSEEQRRAEARNYAEQKVRESDELAKQPDDVKQRVWAQREDKNYLIPILTKKLLNPEISTEQFLSEYPNLVFDDDDDDLLQFTPEQVYEIKKMATTDPELQKIKAKFYAEQQVEARRKRLDQEREREEKALAAKRQRAVH